MLFPAVSLLPWSSVVWSPLCTFILRSIHEGFMYIWSELEAWLVQHGHCQRESTLLFKLTEVILIWLWGFSGTWILILQDSGGNEGLCIRDQCNVSTSFYHSFCLVLSIDDLIKALSITGRGVYHGNVGFINGMGEKWGRQGTIVSYLVWSEVQSNDNKTKRVP